MAQIEPLTTAEHVVIAAMLFVDAWRGDNEQRVLGTREALIQAVDTHRGGWQCYSSTATPEEVFMIDNDLG